MKLTNFIITIASLNIKYNYLTVTVKAINVSQAKSIINSMFKIPFTIKEISEQYSWQPYPHNVYLIRHQNNQQ